MDQSIVSIADLSNYSNSQLEDVTIKASVSMRSLRHGNNRHGYFYMDLRDDSGDIPAFVCTYEPCDKSLDFIQDNRTYTFTNFSLANSNKRETSIPHEKEIVLSNNTSVKLCGNAPKVEWPLTPLYEVYDQDETTLFNIVGLCTGVMETEVVSGVPQRRVTLVDEARSEVVLKVMNQETSLFDELDLTLHPVLFVKDASIHKYRDTTSVKTTRYLQLLHPDDPRAAEIRKSIPQVTPTQNPDRTVARIVPNHRDGSHDDTRRNYVRIADLTDDIVNDNLTIIATVTMKSIRLKEDEFYFLVDLRDDSGEIVAVVSRDACFKYQHFIQKNNTYSITNFLIEDSNAQLTSIPHQKYILLKDNCEVKLRGNGPKVEWPVSPLTVVYNRVGEELFHILGLCTDVGKVAYSRRRVTLVDQIRRKLILEVRDEEMATFDALDLTTHPVFFAKDATFSYTNATESVLEASAYLELLDPDDHRARSVMHALAIPVPSARGAGSEQKDNKEEKKCKKKSK